MDKIRVVLWPSLFLLASHIDAASVTLNCADSGDQFDLIRLNSTDIVSTSTCGVNGPEKTCDFISPGAENCTTCDVNGDWHPISLVRDGSEGYWKSENGVKEVNITISFGQRFLVDFIYFKTGPTPLPEAFILEKSSDFGESYSVFLKYARSDELCRIFFNMSATDQPPEVGQEFCKASSRMDGFVPTENAEFFRGFVGPTHRNAAKRNRTASMIWKETTNIRLRILDFQTLGGHHFRNYVEDRTATQRLYYTIREMSVYGTCFCNQMADKCTYCNVTGEWSCVCKDGTTGSDCSTCLPLFNNNSHVPGKPCEECACNGHAKSCTYNATLDVGVCECENNTVGISCDACAPGFFKKEGLPIADPGACQNECPSCDPLGSVSPICDWDGGRCECKPRVSGELCDSCEDPYTWKFPECLPCNCSEAGSRNLTCSKDTGGCHCKGDYVGRFCDQCAPDAKELWNGTCVTCDKCHQDLLDAVPREADILNALKRGKAGLPTDFNLTSATSDPESLIELVKTVNNLTLASLRDRMMSLNASLAEIGSLKKLRSKNRGFLESADDSLDILSDRIECEFGNFTRLLQAQDSAADSSVSLVTAYMILQDLGLLWARIPAIFNYVTSLFNDEKPQNLNESEYIENATAILVRMGLSRSEIDCLVDEGHSCNVSSRRSLSDMLGKEFDEFHQAVWNDTIEGNMCMEEVVRRLVDLCEERKAQASTLQDKKAFIRKRLRDLKTCSKTAQRASAEAMKLMENLEEPDAIRSRARFNESSRMKAEAEGFLQEAQFLVGNAHGHLKSLENASNFVTAEFNSSTSRLRNRIKELEDLGGSLKKLEKFDSLLQPHETAIASIIDGLKTTRTRGELVEAAILLEVTSADLTALTSKVAEKLSEESIKLEETFKGIQFEDDGFDLLYEKSLSEIELPLVETGNESNASTVISGYGKLARFASEATANLERMFNASRNSRRRDRSEAGSGAVRITTRTPVTSQGADIPVPEFFPVVTDARHLYSVYVNGTEVTDEFQKITETTTSSRPESDPIPHLKSRITFEGIDVPMFKFDDEGEDHHQEILQSTRKTPAEEETSGASKTDEAEATTPLAVTSMSLGTKAPPTTASTTPGSARSWWSSWLSDTIPSVPANEERGKRQAEQSLESSLKIIFKSAMKSHQISKRELTAAGNLTAFVEKSKSDLERESLNLEMTFEKALQMAENVTLSLDTIDKELWPLRMANASKVLMGAENLQRKSSQIQERLLGLHWRQVFELSMRTGFQEEAKATKSSLNSTAEVLKNVTKNILGCLPQVKSAKAVMEQAEKLKLSFDAKLSAFKEKLAAMKNSYAQWQFPVSLDGKKVDLQPGDASKDVFHEVRGHFLWRPSWPWLGDGHIMTITARRAKFRKASRPNKLTRRRRRHEGHRQRHSWRAQEVHRGANDEGNSVAYLKEEVTISTSNSVGKIVACVQMQATEKTCTGGSVKIKDGRKWLDVSVTWNGTSLALILSDERRELDVEAKLNGRRRHAPFTSDSYRLSKVTIGGSPGNLGCVMDVSVGGRMVSTKVLAGFSKCADTTYNATGMGPANQIACFSPPLEIRPDDLNLDTASSNFTSLSISFGGNGGSGSPPVFSLNLTPNVSDSENVGNSVSISVDPLKHRMCAWTDETSFCEEGSRLFFTSPERNLSLLSLATTDRSTVDAKWAKLAVKLHDVPANALILGAGRSDDVIPDASTFCVRDLYLGKKKVQFLPFAFRSKTSFITYSESFASSAMCLRWLFGEPPLSVSTEALGRSVRFEFFIRPRLGDIRSSPEDAGTVIPILKMNCAEKNFTLTYYARPATNESQLIIEDGRTFLTKKKSGFRQSSESEKILVGLVGYSQGWHSLSMELTKDMGLFLCVDFECGERTPAKRWTKSHHSSPRCKWELNFGFMLGANNPWSKDVNSMSQDSVDLGRKNEGRLYIRNLKIDDRTMSFWSSANARVCPTEITS